MAVAERTTTTIQWHLFTVDDYMKMGEVGILTDKVRVELIEGIICEMSPIGSAHASLVNILASYLIKHLSDAYRVSIQNPVQLNARSMPQPDLAVLRAREDNYRTRHPQAIDVFIVIEVSDSTLEFERKVKIPLYAAASIPEYWIVDVEGKTIEQYTQPTAQTYAQHTTLKAGDTLKAAQFPEFSLTINEIFGINPTE